MTNRDNRTNLRELDSSTRDAACAFCALLDQSEKAVGLVAAGEFGSLFLNTNQSHRGRCIFLFRDHVEDPAGLSLEEFSGFARELHGFVRLVKREFDPVLINVALLGNGVRHLHWHIIPRYKDDSNLTGPPWPHERIRLTDDEYRRAAAALRQAYVTEHS